MIDIKYGRLFSVELLHKYTGNQVCNDFTIVPSLRTRQILSNHRIVVKQQDNILFAGVDLDPVALHLPIPVQQPFIVPGEGLQLTFFLLLNNPLFFNYTSIRAANNNGNVYYFTNRNNNISNSKNFITGSLPAFAGGTTYPYEDMVVRTGITFQSVRGNNSADLTSTNWRQVDSNRFMSATDLVSWIPSISQVSLKTITPFIDVKITGYDGSGNYTQPVFDTIIKNPGNLPSFPLDLSGLESGKYLLSINGAPATPVYLNDELGSTQVFGVIDLFIESTLPAAYKMLDASNILLSPVYSVYFLNRATTWKYILVRQSGATLTESADFYKFTTTPQTIPPSPTTIVSQFPIPLSETPLKLSLDGQEKPRLPCASADRLILHDPDPVYCSEIFLNY